MTYSFQCPKCKNIEERKIPLSSYDTKKDKQFCNCGTVMKRILDIPTNIVLCNGMVGTDGGWNK